MKRIWWPFCLLMLSRRIMCTWGPQSVAAPLCHVARPAKACSEPRSHRSLHARGTGPSCPAERSNENLSLRRCRSEIRLVRHRDFVVEQVPIALGADLLMELLLHAPIPSHSRPWLVVCVRVLHREGHFHGLAVVDH